MRMVAKGREQIMAPQNSSPPNPEAWAAQLRLDISERLRQHEKGEAQWMSRVEVAQVQSSTKLDAVDGRLSHLMGMQADHGKDITLLKQQLEAGKAKLAAVAALVSVVVSGLIAAAIRAMQ
mgnify:CR=1 FL=1